MQLKGQCHCGAIVYAIDGEPITHSLCHCSDCRKHAGAPAVGWLMMRMDAVTVSHGKPKIYESSEHGRRHFLEHAGRGFSIPMM